MSQSSNVFEALQKYGSYAPENYLTESFVYLLDLLLTREPVAGLEMINWVCGLGTPNRLTQASAIKIDTQVDITPHGIVDIQIQSGESAVYYVEVKLDSPLDGDQLALYRDDLLQRHKGKQTGMVFLARSRQAAIPTRLTPQEYYHVCWYEVYDWIQNLLVHDEVTAFFAASFQRFLEGKTMNFLQVGNEYTDGIAAMNNLTQMLHAAIDAALPKKATKNTGGFGWRGFRVDGKFYCGIRFDRPLAVVFENNLGNNASYKPVLDLNEVGFFALGKNEQFETLVRFVKESYEAAPAAEGQMF